MKVRSLKKNTLANYAGQMYLMVIGVVVTPLYLEYLGPEPFGLIGFFAMMQAWLNLLDMGMSPTLSRQVAHQRGLGNGYEFLLRIIKSFELIFIVIALLVGLIFFISSEWMASEWIHLQSLSTQEVAYVFCLMGIAAGLRLVSSLYRSGLLGFEDQIWLNISLIIIASVKYIGSLLLIIYVTNDVLVFFLYQLAVGFLELLLVLWRFYRLMPATTFSVPIISFHLDAIKSVIPFSIAIAYTTFIWIAVTQVDKLILSGKLALTDYGYFSLVVLISSVINALSGPIGQAIQPRLTLLLSSGKKKEMLDLYRASTQVVTLISMSVAVLVALFSQPLIYAWTGSHEAALWAKDILFWYALGNGIYAILAFQYYLQVAHGDLKLHVRGGNISLLFDVPVMVYAALEFGAFGAAVAWFCLRLLWFMFWVPVIHSRFAPGLHVGWLLRDVGVIVFGVVFISVVFYFNVDLDLSSSRLTLFAEMVLMGVGVLLFGALCSGFLRNKLRVFLNGL